MESLPCELVGRLPVDQGSLASLACASKSMRRAVTDAWTFRAVRLSEDHIGAMHRLSARHLVVTGPRRPGAPPSRPSPAPVPRPSPALASLELRDARVYSDDFWTDVFAKAPALVEVVVHPVFFPDTFDMTLRSCFCLMRLGCDRLERLEVRGSGYPLCFPSVTTAPSFAFPRLVHLAVTGPQVCAGIDAPLLESAVLEETNFMFRAPNNRSPWAVRRLSDHTKGAIKRLVWSTPVYKVPLPPGFAALVDLDVAVRDIRTPYEFSQALASMRHVPPTVAHLRITLEFSTMRWDCCPLDYDVPVLAHLPALEVLEVVVSFPSPGVGGLVRTMLGARPRPLRRVSLRALGGPAESHESLLREMHGDGVDPEASEVEDLELVIASVHLACMVPSADARAAMATFARAAVELRGLPTTHPVPHPRLSVLPLVPLQ